MGLLDLPAPVFAWTDGVLSGTLPPLARLALWALLISALSMALYALLSPQAELKRLKTEMRAARRALHDHDGDFDGVKTLAARSVGLSLRHLRLVAPAALIACIPVIMLIVWLAKAYGPAMTDSGLPLDMRVTGGDAKLRVVTPGREPDGAGSGALLAVFGADGTFIAQAPLSPRLTRLEKRRWWHWLAGSPAGYLPPDAPIDSVQVHWPRYETHAIGPAWLRGWETPFLALAVVFTLTIQAVFRIE
ncbi:MAG: hypothetical protein ACLFV8_10120 [Alphaproteobacteria bacterium]